MVNIIKHTDLSWETPGIRADVVLALGTEFTSFGAGSTSSSDSEWPEAPVLHDESGSGLEDLEQL
jgi:hypothetical protein